MKTQDNYSPDIVGYSRWLLPFLIVMLLMPVWILDYFPTVDGPLHTYNADLILKLLEGNWPLHQSFFELNNKPDPNWFIHLILAGLIALTNAMIAEKLLLSFYIVFFAAALVYAIRSIDARQSYLVFLGLPMIASFIFHFGFMSFILSLPMSLIVIGYWFRHFQTLTMPQASILGLLMLLLYFFHVVSYIATMLALGILTLGYAILEYRQQTKSQAHSNIWTLIKRLLPIGIAALPSLILLLSFLLGRDVVTEPSNGPITRLLHLAAMTQLVSFHPLEGIFSIALGATLFGLLGYRLLALFQTRNTQASDLLLLVLIAELALYAFTPDSLVTTPGGITGGGLIQLRLSFIPPFIILLWLATQTIAPRLQKPIVVMGSSITVALFILHAFSYQKIQTLQRDYQSADFHIENGSTYMPLRAGIIKETPDEGVVSARFDIFTHYGNRIAQTTDNVNLQNLEAMVGYFAVKFKPGLNPYASQGRLDISLPAVKLLAYENISNETIRYVSLWAESHANDPEKLTAIKEQLKTSYDLIYTSPKGYLTLYRRKLTMRSQLIPSL